MDDCVNFEGVFRNPCKRVRRRLIWAVSSCDVRMVSKAKPMAIIPGSCRSDFTVFYEEFVAFVDSRDAFLFGVGELVPVFFRNFFDKVIVMLGVCWPSVG